MIVEGFTADSRKTLHAHEVRYLLKESTPDEIGRAILAVTGGDVLLDGHVAGRVRDREMLDLMARGLANPAIAERLAYAAGPAHAVGLPWAPEAGGPT